MSISSRVPLEHPLLAAARVIGVALDEVSGSDPVFLSTAEKRALLVELTRSWGRVAGLLARTLAVGEDVAVETGSRSAAAWLAVETGTSLREAARVERVGAGLGRWPPVAAAVAGGVVGFEQAEVLVRALDDLPDGLDPGLVAGAETHLVGEATRFGPRELRVLGRRVLEVVAPEIAEAQEAAALEAEERRARAATRLVVPAPRGRVDRPAGPVARPGGVAAAGLPGRDDQPPPPRPLNGTVDGTVAGAVG